jgi:hypothetical protein
MGTFPFQENPHGRTGNRTLDLMIIKQKLRPLDHEAGLKFDVETAIIALDQTASAECFCLLVL